MIFKTILTLAFVATAAAAQQRATDSTQASIELVVARYAQADTAWWAQLSAFALDPLLYVVAVPSRGGAVTSVPHLVSVAGHTDSHLAELSRSLRTKLVLEQKEPCWPVRPDGCRMGVHQGVVGFSPATISGRGESATLTLFRIGRNTGRRTPVLLSAIQFTLTRSAGAWQVDSVRVGAG